MKTKQLTAKEVVRKYEGKYIDVYQVPSYMFDDGLPRYEVRKSFRDIHEDTTLVEDENFINNY